MGYYGGGGRTCTENRNISPGVPPEAGRQGYSTSQVEDVPGPTWQSPGRRNLESACRDRTEGRGLPALKLRRGEARLRRGSGGRGSTNAYSLELACLPDKSNLSLAGVSGCENG